MRFLLAALFHLVPLYAAAQIERPGAAAREHFYTRAFANNAADYDTLGVLYQTALAAGDSTEAVLAGSWYAMAARAYDTELAGRLATVALDRAERLGLGRLDFRVAPAHVTRGFLYPTYEGDLIRRDSATRAAPPGTFFHFSTLIERAMAMSTPCDERIEDIFTQLDDFLASYRGPDRAMLQDSEYGGIRASYHKRCRGNYEQAALLLERKLAYHEADRSDSLYMNIWIETLAELALVYTDLGRISDAKDLLAQVDHIDFRRLPIHIVHYTNLNTSLQYALKATGQSRRAKERLLEQLAHTQANRNPYYPAIFNLIYTGLYQMSLELGELTEARGYLLAQREHLPDFDLEYYNDLALINYSLSDHQAAIDTAEMALRTVCGDCPGGFPGAETELPGVSFATSYVAGLYKTLRRARYAQLVRGGATQADLREVARFDDRIIALEERAYRKRATSTQGHFANSSALVHFYNDLAATAAWRYELANDPTAQQAILTAAERGKANDLKRRLPTGTVPDSLVRREMIVSRRLQQLRLQLATTDAPPAELTDRYLNQAAEYDELWKRLRATYGDRLRRNFSTGTTELADVQRTLPNDAVFLNYVIADKLARAELIIQVISPTVATSVRLPLDGNLNATVTRYRRLLRSPLQQQTRRRQQLLELSADLYRQLIAPVADLIPAGARLMICPDKDLVFVPFETLVANVRPGGYDQQPFLLRDHAINYQYSAAAYVDARRRARPPGNRVQVFAPVFTGNVALAAPSTTGRGGAAGAADTLVEGVRGGLLDPLPASRTEARGVAGAYGKATSEIYLDRSANRRQLLELLRRPSRITHVATHGFVNAEDGGLSALACYDEAGTGSLLYAAEISLDTVPSDLLVLSSCESGLGRNVSGDGLLSLNRAFVAAGVRNVISTLWKIDDRASSALMVDFHRRVAGGSGYTWALRAAKLGLLQQPATAGPRLWAPFVLLGE